MADNVWQQLSQDADNGVLRLDPNGLGDVVGQIQTFLDDLDGLSELMTHVETISGFGNFSNGQLLQGKFANKASGTDNSIGQRITDIADQAKNMQDAFTKAIKNYLDTDGVNEDKLKPYQDRVSSLEGAGPGAVSGPGPAAKLVQAAEGVWQPPS